MGRKFKIIQIWERFCCMGCRDHIVDQLLGLSLSRCAVEHPNGTGGNNMDLIFSEYVFYDLLDRCHRPFRLQHRLRDCQKTRSVYPIKIELHAQIPLQLPADLFHHRKEQEAQAALYQRQKDAEAVRYEQEQAAEAAKKAAEAARFAKEQEAAGIAAVGQAEAEAIRAKALAEAEGIDKKAEAMKKYGEAAVIEMIMNALPEIAKNVAEPLSKVDKITMYGEGNSAKLLSDIVNGTTQVTEGISAGMGLDLKSLLAGALGGKLAAGNSQPVQVTVTPQAQPDAAAASADTPEQQV